MYIVCINPIKDFRRHQTYIWYNTDYIDMDIKYYSIKNRSGVVVGYMNLGQIDANFCSMFNWNKFDRECSKIFHDSMDGKCVL